MSQVGFLTHLVPLIAGRAAAGAAVDPGLAVAVNAVMALVGRVVLGFVIDRLEPTARLGAVLPGAGRRHRRAGPRRGAAGGLRRLRGLRLLGRQQHHPVAADRAARVRRQQFPAIVALSTAVVQILYAFGPGLLGILRDAFGGYGVPLAVCMALNLAASAMILMRPRPALA